MIKTKIPNINIKENFKKIFTQRIIKDCKKVQGHKELIENFILVLDNYTLDLVNSFLEIYDLIEVGVIKIDSLFKTRAKVEGSHALYFIKPDKNSIDQILRDFDSSDSVYSFCHIVFCTQPDNAIFDKILSNSNLCYSLLNLKVAYLDLITYDDSIFSLSLENDFNSIYLNNFDSKIYHDIKKKCISFLSLTFGFKELFLVYSKDRYAEKLSNELYLNFKERNRVKSNSLLEDNTSQVIVVILDRVNDLFSPVLHDRSYMSQLFEFTETDEFSFNYKNTSSNEEIKSNLDDKDNIFITYKYSDLRLCNAEIKENYNNLLNSIRNKQNSSDNEDALELMKTFPQYKEFIDDYLKHINKIDEINNTKKLKKKKIDSIDVEIFIKEYIFATGKNYDLKDVNYKKLDLSYFKDDVLFRFSLLAKFCLKLGNDVIDILAKSNKSCLNKIEKIMKELNLDDEKPFESINFDQDTSDKINNGGCLKFPLYKSRKLLQDIYENNIDLNKFDVKKIGTSNNNNKDIKIFQGMKLFGDSKNIPNVIFFVLGGMTHNEISQLNKYAISKNNKFNIICGSTNIYNTKDYVQMLKEMKNSKNSNDTFNTKPENNPDDKIYMNN